MSFYILLYYLYSFPLALELFIFLVLLLVSALIRKPSSGEPAQGFYVRLLAISFVLAGGVRTGIPLIMEGKFFFWLAFTYLFIFFGLFYLSRRKFRFLLSVSLFYAVAAFFICQNIFTNVRVDRTYPVVLEEGETAGAHKDHPSQHHLRFVYAEHPDHFDFVYSNAMYNRLQNKKDRQLTASVQLRFHWGVFAGHRLVAVDDIKVPTGDFGGSGRKGQKQTPSPFPTYYFGL